MFDQSPEQNYRGFYNLALLLLFVTNLRLIIENYLKYGLLVSLNIRVAPSDVESLLVGLSIVVIAAYVIYFLEASNARMKSSFITFIQSLIIPSTIVYACYLTWYDIQYPFAGGILVFMGTILFLKCISYVLTNAALRQFDVCPLSYQGRSTHLSSRKRRKRSSSMTYRILITSQYPTLRTCMSLLPSLVRD